MLYWLFAMHNITPGEYDAKLEWEKLLLCAFFEAEMEAGED